MLLIGLVIGLSVFSVFMLLNESNEMSDIELFNEAMEMDIYEANACAELQFESIDESRECLLDMIK